MRRKWRKSECRVLARLRSVAGIIFKTELMFHILTSTFDFLSEPDQDNYCINIPYLNKCALNTFLCHACLWANMFPACWEQIAWDMTWWNTQESTFAAIFTVSMYNIDNCFLDYDRFSSPHSTNNLCKRILRIYYELFSLRDHHNRVFQFHI